jgi:hypothetical protein
MSCNFIIRDPLDWFYNGLSSRRALSYYMGYRKLIFTNWISRINKITHVT